MARAGGSTADGRAVLKATRGGYDGRGVAVVDAATAAGQTQTWLDAGAGLLVEELVPFTRELSALVARSPSGQAVTYPVVESVQVDGICREVYAPAPGLDPELPQGAAARRVRQSVLLPVTSQSLRSLVLTGAQPAL